MRVAAAFRKVYRVPLLLSIITLAGLFSALLGDGIWDVLSWLLLSVPILVLGFFLFGLRLKTLVSTEIDQS